MARKNTIACVYMLRNTVNNKIYIGETVNYADRMSFYKGTKHRIDTKQAKPRPIDIAICKYGWDAFKPIILVKDGMEDVEKRKRTEAGIIAAFNSTDPKIGYNLAGESKVIIARHTRKGVKTKLSTKILKSNPIISYNIATGEKFIWFGSKSFADYLGIDRAQVARPLKNGKSVHGYYVFTLDKKLRDKNADAIIAAKANASSTNGLAAIALKEYTDAYESVTEFAKMWGC